MIASSFCDQQFQRLSIAATSLAERVTPPLLFGLAPCGVYPALDIAIEAVRSYINPASAGRTFSPLPRMNGAVCFLWHFPCQKRTPRLLRDPLPALAVNERTTLWSSDFPLLRSCLPVEGPCGPRAGACAEQRSSGLPALLIC